MPAKRRLLCKRNRAPHGDLAHRSCDRPGQCRASAGAYCLPARSTNHAHADFWLSERGEGQRAVGSKYSVNVLRGQNVWLYSPVRRGGISASSIAAVPMRFRRYSRTPPWSSAGWRGDGAIRHPVAQGCRPVSRSIETKANAASASEKYTVFVTTSVTTSFLVTIASSNPVSRDST